MKQTTGCFQKIVHSFFFWTKTQSVQWIGWSLPVPNAYADDNSFFGLLERLNILESFGSIESLDIEVGRKTLPKFWEKLTFDFFVSRCNPAVTTTVTAPAMRVNWLSIGGRAAAVNCKPSSSCFDQDFSMLPLSSESFHKSTYLNAFRIEYWRSAELELWCKISFLIVEADLSTTDYDLCSAEEGAK